MPNVNNAKGVLNELYLAREFANNGTYGISYRSNDIKIDDLVKELILQVGPQQAAEIDAKAPEMCHLIKTHAVQDGYLSHIHDISQVAWTSLPDSDQTPGDHEKFTGIKDVNSDGDIGIKTSHGYFFVSAKYGESTTLRNPGKKTIDSIFGITMDLFLETYDELLSRHGFDMTKSRVQLHAEYKASKGTPSAATAEELGKNLKRIVAGAVWSRCQKIESARIRDIILTLSAPETHFMHYRAATKPAEMIVEKSRESVEKLLDQYSSFSVGDSKTSTSYVNFYGIRKYDGKREVVGRFSLKFKSGPFTNLQGNFVLPALHRKKKKRVWYVFDIDDTLFDSDPVNGAKADLMGPDGFIRKLSSHEYSTYEFKEGEYTSHSEFEDANLFFTTCKPIDRVHEKMVRLLQKGKKVSIMTARNYFTDMDEFHRVLAYWDIDCEAHMAGSRSEHRTSAARKKAVFLDEIAKWGYDEIHFYDDSASNIEAFLSISWDHPQIKLVAHKVEHDRKKDKTVIRKMLP